MKIRMNVRGPIDCTAFSTVWLPLYDVVIDKKQITTKIMRKTRGLGRHFPTIYIDDPVNIRVMDIYEYYIRVLYGEAPCR